METTLSSKILRVAVGAPLVLALATCSSNNSPPASDAGSSSTVATSSTSTGSSGSTTSGTVATTSSSGAITDGGADTGTPLSPFDTVFSDVLSHCVGCHAIQSDGGPGLGISGGKLDMGDAAVAYVQLVGDGGGALAQGALCGAFGTDAGLKRVVPNEPLQSLLYNKLASNVGDGGSITLSDGGAEVFCGHPMPLNLPAVSAAAVKEISDWIDAGAKP
jgi:hypothetical protein